MIGYFFATYREAEPFLSLLGFRSSTTHTAPELFENTDTEVCVCICGMGPRSAEKSIVQYLREKPITSVINAGIAGSLTDTLPIGTIVRVTHISARYTDDCFETDHTHQFMELVPGRLITSCEPVFDSVLRASLNTSADIVDMEAFELIRACATKHIPFQAIKALSDNSHSFDRKTLFKTIDSLSVSIAHHLYNSLQSTK